MRGCKCGYCRRERETILHRYDHGNRRYAWRWRDDQGERCPFCWGYGHDDGGPGPWSCRTCDGTGTLPKNWEFPPDFADHYTISA